MVLTASSALSPGRKLCQWQRDLISRFVLIACSQGHDVISNSNPIVPLCKVHHVIMPAVTLTNAFETTGRVTRDVIGDVMTYAYLSWLAA